MQITNEEYNQIIKEMADRWRDVIYMNADKMLRNKLSKEHIEALLEGKDTLEITHALKFIVSDLRQILGRLRRKSKK